MVTTQMIVVVFRFGSHELRELFLEPSIKGDMVACLGVSETGAGSDVASECRCYRTVAVLFYPLINDFQSAGIVV